MCEVEGSNVVDLGIDLSEFYMSVEWDILEVPAVRSDTAQGKQSENWVTKGFFGFSKINIRLGLLTSSHVTHL